MAVKAINSIKAPIADELLKFEEHFRNAMKSKVALLDKIMYYIVQKKGKQVRPMLVFLCAKSCGQINDSTYTAASLIELVHTASLVHDDVVDDSNERRGAFSINALWKNKIAVLVGDYLLTKGLFIALDNDEYEQLKILSGAVKEITEGELLQFEKSRKLDIDEADYFKVIRQKTASLIAASCKAGAVSTTKNQEYIDAIYNFGEDIGIAFQIKDDIFDYGTNIIGKPRGIDIKEKKMTLPLIYALNQSSKSVKRKYIKYIKKDSKNSKKVKEIIDHVHKMGGLEYAQEKMLEYKAKALSHISIIPDSESKQALLKLVDYIVERKH